MILPNNLLFADVEAWLSEGYEVVLTAKGASMFPFIVGGRDRVVLRQLAEVHLGDIVLARLSEGRHVLHRVYACAGEELVLMGDGNVVGTERCRLADVCGVAITIVRKGHEVDARSEAEQRRARWWKRLLPVRRYVLGVWRRVQQRTNEETQVCD